MSLHIKTYDIIICTPTQGPQHVGGVKPTKIKDEISKLLDLVTVRDLFAIDKGNEITLRIVASK